MSMVQYYNRLVDCSLNRIDWGTHAVNGTAPAEHRKNVALLRSSYALWASLLIDSVLEMNVKAEVLHCVLQRWVTTVNSLTYRDLSSICGNAYDQIRRMNNLLNGPTRWSQFKAEVPDIQKLPFMSPLVKRFLSNPDPRSLHNILSILVYPFRTRVYDGELLESAVVDYKSIEDELARNDDRGYDQDLVKDLNRIIKRWMQHCDFGSIAPCVTPGAVSDPKLRTLCEKLGGMLPDIRVIQLLKYSQMLKGEEDDYAVCNLHTKAYSTSIAAREISPSCERLIALGMQYPWRTARVIFVPKNASKLRTVCCEPVFLQAWQSGVQQYVYAYIRKHHYLSAHFPLHDQEIVRQLCLKGSMFQSHATLDLSAASDRISWQVVKQVFAGTPYALWCGAARSIYALLPDRSLLRQRKAFAMGSCLCFPTMTLLIGACCAYIERRLKDFGRRWTVYGDDIIVPNEWVKPLILILEHLGLKVNISKSYVGPEQYREACGTEAYAGHDVTPLRYPRKFDTNASVEKLVSTYISMANEYFLDQKRVMRSRILHVMGTDLHLGPYARKGRQILFGPVQDEAVGGYLFSAEPTNFRAPVHHSDETWPVGHWDYQADMWLTRYAGVVERLKVGVPQSYDEEVALLKYCIMRDTVTAPPFYPWVETIPLVNTPAIEEPSDKYSRQAVLAPTLSRGWKQ